jgi:hypothetical protein
VMGGCLRIFGGIILIILAIILARLFFYSAIFLLFQGPIGIIIVIALIAVAIVLFIKARK